MTQTPTPRRTFKLSVSWRDALEAAERMRPMHNGQPYIIRFTRSVRVQHFIAMLAFMALAITGLARAFDDTRLGQILVRLMGGLEQARQIHYLFALLLAVLAVYHTVDAADSYFVRRIRAVMLPTRQDWKDFVQVLLLNLGKSNKLPLYDRYSYEEKGVYWSVALSVLLLGFSGLVMWFPAHISHVIPWQIYPYAVVLHRWVAIFVVAVVALAHTYQVLLRKRNLSIFTGRMTLDDMRAEHPVELAYLERAEKLTNETQWPQELKFHVTER